MVCVLMADSPDNAIYLGLTALLEWIELLVPVKKKLCNFSLCCMSKPSRHMTSK